LNHGRLLLNLPTSTMGYVCLVCGGKGLVAFADLISRSLGASARMLTRVGASRGTRAGEQDAEPERSNPGDGAGFNEVGQSGVEASVRPVSGRVCPRWQPQGLILTFAHTLPCTHAQKSARTHARAHAHSREHARARVQTCSRTHPHPHPHPHAHHTNTYS
jgi:hypothetical protein